MHSHTPSTDSAFKRQIAFRLDAEQWQQLKAAADEHGSMQAAFLAALRALRPGDEPKPDEKPAEAAPKRKPAQRKQSRRATPATAKPQRSSKPAATEATQDPDAEIRSRHAAKEVGVKANTMRGYIRSGRIPGRYDETLGWMTTRRAVDVYARRKARQSGK